MTFFFAPPVVYLEFSIARNDSANLSRTGFLMWYILSDAKRNPVKILF